MNITGRSLIVQIIHNNKQQNCKREEGMSIKQSNGAAKEKGDEGIRSQ